MLPMFPFQAIPAPCFHAFLKQEIIYCEVVLQFPMKHSYASLSLVWLPLCCFNWKLCFLRGTNCGIYLKNQTYETLSVGSHHANGEEHDPCN